MPESLQAQKQSLQLNIGDAASDAPVAIRFDHVTKRYKLYSSNRARFKSFFSKKVACETVCANDDLSFTIRKGQSVALLGSNGAGKSTALKLITGVIYPSEGTITVNGRVNALLELKAGFDGSLTGRENIYLRGRIMGLSDEEIKKIEPKVIKFANIGPYIDQPLHIYSSGMKSRLGFAFVSFVEGDILVVDEALSVGDRRFAKKCRRRVRRLIKQNALTVLFVTHSTASARKFCDWGIVFEKGRKVFEGSIDAAIAFYEGEEAYEDETAGEDA